jgi:hypothetical protein
MGAESQGQRQDQWISRMPGQMRMPFDVLQRALLGQMVNPPETPMPVPLQQGISNLQGGDVGRAFGLSGGIASRLSGGGANTGFLPGAFLPTASGGQQGTQTREQLGLPPAESHMGEFMPTAQEIRDVGIAPVRSSDKGLNKLNKRAESLEAKIETRAGRGKKSPQATRRLERVQAKINARKDPGA